MPHVEPANCENNSNAKKPCNSCEDRGDFIEFVDETGKSHDMREIIREKSVQKKIWNVCRVQSSLYTMNLSAQTVNHNKQDVGVGKKHGSYDRYLARKKAPHLYSTDPFFGETPKQGNKKYALGFINHCQCKNISIG